MNPAPNFNRLANLYRWMELLTFGPFLSRARTTFLHQTTATRRALVLGDGDGRFTARLLQQNPTVHVHAVDASSAMLASLLRRAGSHTPRVQTELADLRSWQPHTPPQAPPYDLVATHFFLDCLTSEELQSLAARLRPTVSSSALWLVSEFAVPPGWFGSLVARPVVWGLYLAFGWLTGLAVRTLPDHRSALCSAGFALQKRRTWLAGLLISELWSAGQSDSA